ncbi:hypothetical protein CANINC_003669 [Pichia inconspicua]|uniref:Uncharacterized protein n=1 Tax=Pichia inconspicua TaxID=52247 RepID=A0A4T0WY66_9ASCO|nr:hypothetical protein CANINC_003669 [[Candida] inconspicua]
MFQQEKPQQYNQGGYIQQDYNQGYNNNNYNNNNQMGQQYQQQQYNNNQSSHRGSGAASNFFKRLWDSIIFGAGATIGSRLINGICS